MFKQNKHYSIIFVFWKESEYITETIPYVRKHIESFLFFIYWIHYKRVK